MAKIIRGGEVTGGVGGVSKPTLYRNVGGSALALATSATSYLDSTASIEVTLTAGELVRLDYHGTMRQTGGAARMEYKVNILAGSTQIKEVHQVHNTSTADRILPIRMIKTLVVGTDISAGTVTFKVQALNAGSVPLSLEGAQFYVTVFDE